MIVSNNSGSLAAQDRTKLYQKQDVVEQQNRESADASSKLELLRDTLEIRTNSEVNLPVLEDFSLVDVLNKLTTDIFGDHQQAVSAQGNLTPESVLALLND